jgi:DNA-binding MarR family transcriptional regulator
MSRHIGSDVDAPHAHGTSPAGWQHRRKGARLSPETELVPGAKAPAVVAAPSRLSEGDADLPRLTPNQWSILRWLAEGRDVRIRDLAEGRPRVTVTLKSLFHRGLVGYGPRVESEEDSELDRTVRLTPRGRITADQMLRAHAHAQR